MVTVIINDNPLPYTVTVIIYDSVAKSALILRTDNRGCNEHTAGLTLCISLRSVYSAGTRFWVPAGYPEPGTREAP